MKSDVVIVGGGPGGAAAAMFLAKEGIQSTIIEREAFPRYHIGESNTGESGAALRRLGLEQKMMDARHPVKHGVKVYGTTAKNTWFVPVTGRDKDWKLFDQITWQVRRSDFDKMMLDEAQARGASLVHGKAARPLLRDDGSVRGVQIESAGGSRVIETDMLIDASGQATWLANLGGVTGPKYLGAYDKQIAIFSQVEGALRDTGSARDQMPDNTLIFYNQKFHWSWFIPLDQDVVSVGVVAPAQYFLDKRESKLDYLRRELHELNPEVKRRIPDIKFVEDVHVIPNYSFQVKRFTGKGFICLGDAHRFIDPIFSFGLTVTMNEAEFAVPYIKRWLNGERRDQERPFAEYELFAEQGADVLEDMIDLFWEQPFAFAAFVYWRYTDYMTDCFAGRIYERQPSPALLAFRELLKRQRDYANDDVYSIPIGSRFHPERAPIWEPNSPVATTEEWLGRR